MTRNRALVAFLLLLTSLAIANTAMAARNVFGPGGGEGVRRGYHAQTGKLSFIGAGPSSPIEIPAAMVQGVSPTSRSNAVVAVYGPEFGLGNPSQELRLMNAPAQLNGRTSTRYQQTYKGIPVLGGEIIVNQDSRGRLFSMSGEISPGLQLQVAPTVPADKAATLAAALIGKHYQLSSSELNISNPELWVFDERLLRPSTRPVELVWRFEVSGRERLDIRELVLINARTGGVSLHFNQMDSLAPTVTPTQTSTPTPTPAPSATPTATATPRPSLLTYTAGNTSSLPGTFLCDETQPLCTGGTDTHADAAHAYAFDSYDFYLSQHGRDSLDDAGMTLVSSVHYSSGYANAFWNGYQMVYGDAYGFPLADDVVGHELTHGVTERTSGLFYYYQSGAINESFSDVWGEFIDQSNGAGNDSTGVKWLMGEDVSGLGALRDMADPPAYSDPDKISSPYYYTGNADLGWFGDNGGVHTNSGVNNKATYLMTDGGTFNGYTITALGIDKVAAIYYEVQTSLLTSGADYHDLYYAMYQGCLNLIPGALGITTADCQQVRDATEAVEMNLEPESGYNPEAELCPGAGDPTDLFYDDLESGGSNFGIGSVTGANAWGIGSFYAVSPVSSIWGDDAYTSSDSYVFTASDVALPAGSQPYLYFNHAFGFEDPNWDGGWVEYSTDGGSTWNDASGLFDEGLSYNGSISTDWDNSNAGHQAYVGDSHGYVSTRFDLSGLAGQSFRFRWRLSTDSIGYDWGWFIDDVRIYTCGSPAPTPIFSDVSADYWARQYIEILYENGYIAGCQLSPPKYCPDRTLNRAESAVFVLRGAYGAIPDPPYPTPATPTFDDVDPSYWGYGWIESMWTDGFTAGCGTDPLIYCPLRDHTRAEGSVFFLRIKNGVSYTPPAPVGIFADVSLAAWYAGWVEAAYNEGLLPPCQTDPLKFCPDDGLDRSWAAYMMVWAKGGFGLPVPTLVPTSTATPGP